MTQQQMTKRTSAQFEAITSFANLMNMDLDEAATQWSKHKTKSMAFLWDRWYSNA